MNRASWKFALTEVCIRSRESRTDRGKSRRLRGEWRGRGEVLEKILADRRQVARRVRTASAEDYEQAVARAQEAFEKWRTSRLVRCAAKPCGSSATRCASEVRSRQTRYPRDGQDHRRRRRRSAGDDRHLRLRGRPIAPALRPDDSIGTAQPSPDGTMASARSGRGHFCLQFSGRGVVLERALAAVCGDATIWKPSEKTPLTAIAVIKIAERVCRETGADPAIFSLLIGDGATVGQKLAADRRVPLVSATGSTRMGFEVRKTVQAASAKRYSNSAATTPSSSRPTADLEMATSRFSSARSARPVSVAPRRGASSCTNRSRTKLREKLLRRLQVGRRSEIRSIAKTLMGPLIDPPAVENVQHRLRKVKSEGGEILYGGEKLDGAKFPGGCYMTPCLAHAQARVQDRARRDVRAFALSHELPRFR